jgi:uncharacterized protein
VRFVDTSFFIALLLARDDHHRDAVALWKDQGDRLVTTTHVVGETWTGLRRRAGHAAASASYEGAITEPRLSMASVDHDAELVAWRWLLRHDEREYSFVDATSIAFMRAKRVRDVLAFDGDFSAVGFVELRP